MKSRVIFSRKSDDWSTPTDLYDKLDKEFGFTYDPCPLGDNLGFILSWSGRVFCNPPYSDIKRFIQKGLLELRAGNCELIVYLIPSRTDTRWFHDYLYNKPNVELRFIKGRLKFGNSKNAAPFPSMLAIVKNG